MVYDNSTAAKRKRESTRSDPETLRRLGQLNYQRNRESIRRRQNARDRTNDLIRQKKRYAENVVLQMKAIWAKMIQRCYSKSCDSYKYYGERGIKVCERWLHSFELFRLDMGDRPVGLSIDRIDNNGNYEPGNCKWSTKSEQMKNRRPQKRFGPLKDLARSCECQVCKVCKNRQAVKRYAARKKAV